MNMYGLDYQPFGVLQEELASIPQQTELLIAHQTWGDWMGDLTSPQGDFAQIPANITHLLSGDYHKFKIEHYKNAGGRPILCCSPGAVAAQAINEPHEHCCVLLTKDAKFEKHGLHSRRFIDWPTILYQEDLAAFVSGIDATLTELFEFTDAHDYPDEIRQPYLRVTYTHKLPDVVRRVEKIVNGRALLYFKELPPEDKQPQKAKAQIPDSLTPLGLLPQRVNKDEKPKTFALASRLLEAADPQEEFQRWWTEQTTEDAS
jgi:hypothetical protein